jgi:hypothetical protein
MVEESGASLIEVGPHSKTQDSALLLWRPKRTTYSLRSGNSSFGTDDTEFGAGHDLRRSGYHISDLSPLALVNVT